MTRSAYLETDPKAWARFAKRGLVSAGSGLLLAAVLCFIAYNWNRMCPFLKLGLLELGILAALGLALRQGLDSASGSILLFVSAFLIGPLLAVYGQSYPSGAPLSKLLFTWTLAMLPLAWISCNSVLWLLWIIVLNAGCFMRLGFENNFWFALGDHGHAALLMALMDFALYQLALFLGKRGNLDWLKRPWVWRLTLLGHLFFLHWFNLMTLYSYGKTVQPAWAVPGTLFIIASSAWLAVQAVLDKDLPTMILLMMSGMTLINSYFPKVIDRDNGQAIWMLFCYGNLALTGLCTALLLNLHKRWRQA